MGVSPMFGVVAAAFFLAASSSYAFPIGRRAQQISRYHESSSQLRLAKAAAKKKNEKSTGGGGLKGFGSPTSKSKTEVEIDRTKPARNFYDFLTTGDADDNLARCALGYFPLDGGAKLRGIVATKMIKKGENCIRIPYELAINLGAEGSDPTIPALEFLRDYCETMVEGASKTERRPYFEMLPPYRGDDSMGSTDFFSEEALDALQSPLIVEETKLRRELAKLRFDSGVGEDFPSWIDGTAVTLDHLQWAVWLVTSRVLTVQGDEAEGKSYRLLIPFLDMCNHDRSSSHVLTGRAVPGGELRVVAGTGVKEGEQINICYGGGVAGNDRFIQDYGFLDTSNKAEAYSMVAQQLIGKRRGVEGAGAGKFMTEQDTERTLKELRKTTMEADRQLIATATDMQIRMAYQYRLGIKEALSKFIVMQ